MLTVLYFARLREQIGKAEEQINLPDTVATLADLIDWLSAQGPAYRQAFAELTQIRAAINEQAATLDAPVKDGDEVAFFPPMTGG
ncbi:MAG: molybdopterin converting factor subunit 1 [Alphaproteobacteria bacterium]